jgi:DNA-binding MarR family transcriptional regulator
MNDIGNKNDKEIVQNNNLIFVPRWMQFIVILEKYNVEQASRKLNTTYSHAVKIVNALIKKNYIYKIRDPKNKRQNKIIFNEKGLILQTHVKNLLETLNEMPDTSEKFFNNVK